MKRGVRLRNYPITKLHNRRSRSRGYILITLMLFVALLAIAAIAVLPAITFQIKRDREEEMIHRALEYSRGIKRYYKKFNRYPSRLEELENTNNIRFLRKRYQDPITGKDFKVLHLSDIMLNSGPVMPGLTPPPTAGDQNAGKSDNPPDGQTKVTSSVSSSSSSSSSDTSSSSQQVFGGGGPILGVASASKAQTIREFNGKNRYGDWLFIYDPQSDHGGLLNTPVQPNLNNRNLPGQVPPNAGLPQGGPPQPQGPPNPPPMPPDQ
jgi:type II secretory pathway pseudopilin PulG